MNITSCTKRLDLTKPVQTRDGRNARIICTDARVLCYPIVGLIVEYSECGVEYSECKNGYEMPIKYQLCGHFLADHADNQIDLINKMENFNWDKPFYVVDEKDDFKNYYPAYFSGDIRGLKEVRFIPPSGMECRLGFYEDQTIYQHPNGQIFKLVNF